MPNIIETTPFAVAVLSIAGAANADLFYDPDKSAQMSNLQPVESVRTTSEYLCGNSALFISATATSSDINGRYASITGKIVTGEQSKDISASLDGVIKSGDIITSGLNVRCNKEYGAFKLVFSPGQVFTGKPNEGLVVTSIEIFADGTVIGSRSRRKKK